MPKSKYKPLILEKLEEGPASLRTLQEICGKSSNIRKALHGLIMEGVIEINGYDERCESFKEYCMMFRKVDSDYKNPIYVKELLDNPTKDDNYFKIQQLFNNRINEVNQIYQEELEHLKNIQGKMPLKKAIVSSYINPDQVHHVTGMTSPKKGMNVTYKDMLRKYPEAEVYYLKKKFRTKIAPIIWGENVNYPYFGYNHKSLSYNKSPNPWSYRDRSFVSKYKIYLSHLPISKNVEKTLFNYFIISALRETDKTKREDRIWKLAITLTGDDLSLFVEKLRVIEFLMEYDEYLENFEAILRF